MKAHRAAHPLATMCRMLDVSASGYYAWRTRSRSRRAHEDARLTTAIHRIHAQSRGTDGAPRIHAELVATGTRVSRKRVARLMRAAGLRGVSRRKRIVTTVREPGVRPAPDLVQRTFTAAGPRVSRRDGAGRRRCV
jgi:putative transposase